ncbi:MAG: hydroxyacid dehydrogenase [Lentisphaeria bacterium]|nr:hydroxyacid dehydrogenase [Lentisphaeria bacterium]
MLLLICDAFDASLESKLAQFGEVTTDMSRLAEANVALIRSKTKCTQEWIDQAPNLQIIIRGGVGIDNIDVAYAKTKGIKVSNTPKASSIAVAELAFAMMIAVPNNIVAGHNGMVKGEWLKKSLGRTELYGKTLCVVGLGNIGKELAKRAAAFGMTITSFSVPNLPCDFAETCETLEEAVAKADYISIHTPLLPSTKGMINAELIAKMKDGVVVINTGRGPVVCEDGMTAALESGKVATYATDVWPNDPPAADHKILSAPNTLMLPHLGASTKENLLRIGEEACAIIKSLI